MRSTGDYNVWVVCVLWWTEMCPGHVPAPAIDPRTSVTLIIILIKNEPVPSWTWRWTGTTGWSPSSLPPWLIRIKAGLTESSSSSSSSSSEHSAGRYMSPFVLWESQRSTLSLWHPDCWWLSVCVVPLILNERQRWEQVGESAGWQWGAGGHAGGYWVSGKWKWWMKYWPE